MPLRARLEPGACVGLRTLELLYLPGNIGRRQCRVLLGDARSLLGKAMKLDIHLTEPRPLGFGAG